MSAARFAGTGCRAADRRSLGRTRGVARAPGGGGAPPSPQPAREGLRMRTDEPCPRRWAGSRCRHAGTPGRAPNRRSHSLFEGPGAGPECRHVRDRRPDFPTFPRCIRSCRLLMEGGCTGPTLPGFLALGRPRVAAAGKPGKKAEICIPFSGHSKHPPQRGKVLGRHRAQHRSGPRRRRPTCLQTPCRNPRPDATPPEHRRHAPPDRSSPRSTLPRAGSVAIRGGTGSFRTEVTRDPDPVASGSGIVRTTRPSRSRTNSAPAETRLQPAAPVPGPRSEADSEGSTTGPSGTFRPAKPTTHQPVPFILIASYGCRRPSPGEVPESRQIPATTCLRPSCRATGGRFRRFGSDTVERQQPGTAGPPMHGRASRAGARTGGCASAGTPHPVRRP